MNRLKNRPNILTVLLVILFSIDSLGQNCSFISGTKDKTKGIETVGGITNSKEHYSLLIHKVMSYENDSIIPRYILSLNAASKDLLSDSILKTKGTFELKLRDNSLVILDSVSYFNNPLGYCCALGFQCEVDEKLIQQLSNNPIQTLTVKDILSTTFLPNKQKKQQLIYNCLLIRKPKVKK